MIRPAKKSDINEINNLLFQVLDVHAKGRPDIFIKGTKKYTDEELLDIINDDKRPIFVYTDENDKAIGYAFCVYEETKGITNMKDMKTLYIDDICVDNGHRRQGVAAAIYEYVKVFAKENGFDRITLNVWELNPGAKKFYEKMGLLPLKTMMEMKLK